MTRKVTTLKLFFAFVAIFALFLYFKVTIDNSGTEHKIVLNYDFNIKEKRHDFFNKNYNKYHKNVNESYQLLNFTDQFETISKVQRSIRKNYYSSDIPLVIVLCNKRESKAFQLNNSHKRSWERQEQQLKVMFGSLLLFSKVWYWKVVVLVDKDETFSKLLNIFSDWSRSYKSRLLFEKHIFEMPQSKFVHKWRPCSWIKIFIGDLLQKYEKIVYIDTDVIFLGPIEDLWAEFKKLTGEKFLGIGPEPWYAYENKDKELHKTGGKNGLNTGTLLMNLKKSRNSSFRFSEEIIKETKYVPTLRHDQDVVNSFLHKNPQYFFEMSPRFNFLPSVCALNVSCKECEEKGILILHGADGTFYGNTDPRYNVSFYLYIEL